MAPDLSVRTSCAEPAAVGFAESSIWHAARGVSVVPVQVSLAMANPVGFAPARLIDATCAPDSPAVTVTGTRALDDPTGVRAQSIAEG